MIIILRSEERIGLLPVRKHSKRFLRRLQTAGHGIEVVHPALFSAGFTYLWYVLRLDC